MLRKKCKIPQKPESYKHIQQRSILASNLSEDFFFFVFIEGVGFVIDMCQSMNFQSDREYLGQNYKDTGYLKKNSMEWKIF